MGSSAAILLGTGEIAVFLTDHQKFLIQLCYANKEALSEWKKIDSTHNFSERILIPILKKHLTEFEQIMHGIE